MCASSSTPTSERGKGILLFAVLSFVAVSFFTLIRSDGLSAYVPSPDHSIGRYKYSSLMTSDALSACVPSPNHWESVLSLQHPLSKHSGVYWNGRIYVIGGLRGAAVSPLPTKDVWRAEVSSDGLATGWTATNSTGLPSLSRAAAVVNDGYIYVVGGHDGRQITGTTYVAHVEGHGDTTSWSRSQHSIPLGRDLHQAIVFQDRLYVLGGYTPEGEVNEIWVASLAQDGQIGEWHELNGGLREPLLGFAAVVCSDWLYVLGGWNGNDVTDSVYFARLESDLIDGVYTETAHLPISMYRLTAFVLQDRIFVAGGRAYDPTEDRCVSCAGVWSAEIDPVDGTLAEWVREDTLPLALESHTTVLVNDGPYTGQVYAIGGEEDGDGQRSARAFFWPLAHLSKEAHPAGAVYPSDQVTYTITYSNVGTRLLQNVIITDAVPVNTRLITGSVSGGGYSDGSVITWPVGYLDRSNSSTASFQVRVVDPSAAETPTTSVPTTGQSSWLATPTPVSVASALYPAWSQTIASDNQEVFDRARISRGLTPDCDADLGLEKSHAPYSAVAGEALSYTLLVCNNGPSRAQDVVVLDDLPDSLTLTMAMPSPSSTTPLSWFLGSIPNGSCQEIHLVVQVDPGISGTITNTATVDGSTWDPNPGNNKEDEATVVVSKADLRIDKSADPSSVAPGGTLTYTLIVTNEGPSDARRVIVTDTLPVGVCDLGSLPPTCSRDPLVCALGTVPAGYSDQIQVKVTVCPTSAGILTNTAVVTSTARDSNPENNEAKGLIGVSGQADLRIQMGGNLERVVPGDELVYTLQVNNDGPSDARSMIVSDTLPAGVKFCSSVPPLVCRTDPLTWYVGSLEPLDKWTVEIRVKVSPSASGILVNTASVTSEVYDPDLSNNSDEGQTWAPVPVSNEAYICEDRLWCKESNTVVNSPIKVCLPIVLRAAGR